MDKPFSQACENNKQAIADVLKRVFDHSERVFEIGSGTGQHASWMVSELPHLQWLPSDCEVNLPGIRLWCEGVNTEQLMPPVVFDVNDSDWPDLDVDAVFSANTAHIMPLDVAERMVRRVALKLPTGGVFALYGPFNYSGQFTSESNANFDQWLKSNNPLQGIRNFEDINKIATHFGLSLYEDNSMPANNRLLVWVKQAVAPLKPEQ